MTRTAMESEHWNPQIKLTARDCGFWDVTIKAWKCEPGTFIAHLGTSSRNLPLRMEFTV
jgi:Fibronectin type III-like domain